MRGLIPQAYISVHASIYVKQMLQKLIGSARNIPGNGKCTHAYARSRISTICGYSNP